MPKDTTPEDVADAYMEGWRLGLKALAIYRDGSKEVQPLSTKRKSDKAAEKLLAAPPASDCPTPGSRSPTNSTFRATRATSPSVSIPTAGPANFSSPWPRKAARSAG